MVVLNSERCQTYNKNGGSIYYYVSGRNGLAYISADSHGTGTHLCCRFDGSPGETVIGPPAIRARLQPLWRVQLAQVTEVSMQQQHV
jgi:hypothetical protein